MKAKVFAGLMSLALAWPAIAATRSSDSLFTDVPKGHWAYEAVKKAAEAGILQGYDGKFHGNKPINRYQMALIVSRMLETVSKGGEQTKNLSTQDLQNLEALTIEFADELALLNVKVSTLEDAFAELRHDVEAIKTGGHYGPRGQRAGPSSAGLHGMIETRLVATDANGPSGAVGNITGSGTFVPLTRYAGHVGGTVGAETFQSRILFTIPQVSLSVDRDIDEGIGVHLQLDLDADIASVDNSAPGAPAAAGGTALPAGGGSVGSVNEAYVDIDDFFFGIGAKIGGFAVPFNREYNGTHRTLDYTVTPSAVSWRLDTYRPVGIEFRNEDDIIHWDWRLAIFSGLDGPTGTAATFLDQSGMLVPALTTAVMPAGGTPFFLSNAPFSDAPHGIPFGTGAFDTSGLGAYVRVGDQPDEGFGWDINFLTNGGNLSPGAGKNGTTSDFNFFVASLDYYWRYFDTIFQYYQGSTKDTAGAAAGVNPGPVPNASASPVSSTGMYVLFNYRFDPDNNFTLRVENDQDNVSSVGKVQVTAITVGYNRIVSDHSLFQFEYLLPQSKFTAVAGNTNGAVTNTTDEKDSMISANYKLKF